MSIKSKNAKKGNKDRNSIHRTSRSNTIHRLSDSNHGAYLLQIPKELLTHCTSFLDPKSLLALARCNRYLLDHVKDDDTWRRAFCCFYFGFGPEDTLQNTLEGMMLRRTEPTWKREFIHRYTLHHRYAKSRVALVTHQPCYSDVYDAYLLPGGTALLTASMHHGIIARSYPDTGKTLKGYLTAASSTMAVGNPQNNDTPFVTSIAMGPSTSPNGISVLWGFFTGEVALTTTMAVMKDGAQIRSHLVKCAENEKHARMVCKAVHIGDGHWATADLACQLKVWDGRNRKLRCLWSTPQDPANLIHAIAASLDLGLIIASLGDEIRIWSGFEPETPNWQANIRTTSLLPASEAATLPSDSIKSPPVLIIDPASTKTHIILLFGGYRSEFAQFSKLDVLLSEPSAEVRRTIFSDDGDTRILSIVPSFKAASDETDFLVSGDFLGEVSVWNWGETSSGGPVRSARSWVVQGVGGVSEIVVGDSIFVTGSTGGTVTIHSTLTLQALRTFPPPRAGDNEPIAVWKLILQGDLLIWSIGSRVSCFRVGEVSKNPKQVRYRRSPSSKWMVKGFESKEMKAQILETADRISQEQGQRQQVNETVRLQNRLLDDLGLDEIEAIEYAIMLSREAAEAHSSSVPEQEPLHGDWVGSGGASFSETPDYYQSSDAQGSQPQLVPITRAQSWTFQPHSFEVRDGGSSGNGLPKKGLVEWDSTEGEENSPDNFPPIAGSASPSSASNARGMNWIAAVKASSSPKNATMATEVARGDTEERRDVQGTDSDLRYALELSLAEARSRLEK